MFFPFHKGLPMFSVVYRELLIEEFFSKTSSRDTSEILCLLRSLHCVWYCTPKFISLPSPFTIRPLVLLQNVQFRNILFQKQPVFLMSPTGRKLFVEPLVRVFTAIEIFHIACFR
jgi:hypothetical protein